jgi:hypothetical protein
VRTIEDGKVWMTPPRSREGRERSSALTLPAKDVNVHLRRESHSIHTHTHNIEVHPIDNSKAHSSGNIRPQEGGFG